MLAALTLLAVGLIDARPASAAWTCVGAEYVCGPAPKASAATSSRSAYSNEQRQTRKRSHAKAKAKATTTAWWSDETQAQPRRKSRRHGVRTAAYSQDDAAPTRRSRRQARSYSGDSGSSYQGGMASYYWQPQRVASGGWFNPNAMTAAHKTLPFGTKVRVTNNRNGQSVVVTINDRGPYVAGRVIDLSSAAAGAINMKGAGVVPVSIAVLGR
jgi:rare lipoprotein A